MSYCVCFDDHGTVWVEEHYIRLGVQSPEDIDYGRVLRWEIDQQVRKDVLDKALHDLKPVFQRLHNGLSFNTKNSRYALLQYTNDARDAENEILHTLHALQDNPANLVNAQEATKREIE